MNPMLCIQWINAYRLSGYFFFFCRRTGVSIDRIVLANDVESAFNGSCIFPVMIRASTALRFAAFHMYLYTRGVDTSFLSFRVYGYTVNVSLFQISLILI